MNPVKVILADDHPLMRHWIKLIIKEHPDFITIDEAQDGVELLRELEEETPDLVIIDINIPKLQGLEATEFIKSHYPGVKVLLLTLHRDKQYLRRAMEVGADGYLLKDNMDTDLHIAMQSVLKGKPFISQILHPN